MSALASRLRAALAAGAEDDAVRDLRLQPGDTVEAEAAVLVAITDRPRPGVLLTQRTDTLRRHAGQVAFPGGRRDPDDLDIVAAALREAEEEIALPRTAVTVVGTLARFRLATGYLVTPVVGVVPPNLPLVAQESEVAALFEVPLDHLIDPAQHQQRTGLFGGIERPFVEIAWPERRIWGATAAMIVELAARIAPWT